MYGKELECASLGSINAAAREPVAAEICNYAAHLAERAEMLANRVNGKLAPITTSSCPQPLRGEGKECREYPPLFSALRDKLNVLANSLDSIEETMSRVEV